MDSGYAHEQPGSGSIRKSIVLVAVVAHIVVVVVVVDVAVGGGIAAEADVRIGTPGNFPFVQTVWENCRILEVAVKEHIFKIKLSI